MAPLRYLVTPYLGKLWYLKEKTWPIKTIFYLKWHKYWGRPKSLQKLFKGRYAAKSFWKNFLGLCWILELSGTKKKSEWILSLDLEYFPKFKCCCNQHLCLGENSSKYQSKIFRAESSLAQDEIQNLTQLRSPLPSPFIGGILSHRVAFPSFFATSLFWKQIRQKKLDETSFNSIF